MSSTQITVQCLINALKKLPPNMLVVVPRSCYDPLEHHEGMFNGPSVFEIIDVEDVRSGMNVPDKLENAHWPVLYIGTNSHKDLIDPAWWSCLDDR